MSVKYRRAFAASELPAAGTPFAQGGRMKFTSLMLGMIAASSLCSQACGSAQEWDANGEAMPTEIDELGQPIFNGTAITEAKSGFVRVITTANTSNLPTNVARAVRTTGDASPKILIAGSRVPSAGMKSELKVV